MPQSASEMFLLFAPLLALQLGLIALALYDLVRREHVRFDNKLVWGAVIVLLSLIGPLAYFAVGREES